MKDSKQVRKNRTPRDHKKRPEAKPQEAIQTVLNTSNNRHHLHQHQSEAGSLEMEPNWQLGRNRDFQEVGIHLGEGCSSMKDWQPAGEEQGFQFILENLLRQPQKSHHVLRLCPAMKIISSLRMKRKFMSLPRRR